MPALVSCLLLETSNAASWTAVFVACLIGLFACCLAIAMCVALFHRRKANRDAAYDVFCALLNVFTRRRR
ncbi:hypothetical protein ACQPXB_21085 [Amycolatopsis sp. CA-161197]|uniref:hypothetical protein n=1 Tax=Amycolatopsis sp. CA-161197 TaxID=3239922 RepID=UPI003D92DE90